MLRMWGLIARDEVGPKNLEKKNMALNPPPPPPRSSIRETWKLRFVLLLFFFVFFVFAKMEAQRPRTRRVPDAYQTKT